MLPVRLLSIIAANRPCSWTTIATGNVTLEGLEGVILYIPEQQEARCRPMFRDEVVARRLLIMRRAELQVSIIDSSLIVIFPI